MRRESFPRLFKGLFTGIIFGFLLQKGGVTRYNVIVGQLKLDDFTVLKIILTAVIVGMIGIYALYDLGWVQLSPKNPPLKMVIPGGLIFGIGFAVLGYCPGTLAGAAGQGNLDALIPGLVGITLGAALYAVFKERFGGIFEGEGFSEATLPRYMGLNHWKIILPSAAILVMFLLILEIFF